MNLSVSQRIGGGFALLCLLLLLTSSIAYNSFVSIDRQLKQVTQQASPLVQHSGQLLRQLLQSKYLLLSYLQADSPEQFDQLEQRLKQRQQQFAQIMTRTQSLIGTDQTGLTTLAQISQQTDQLFSQAQQLFLQHRQYWSALSQVTASAPAFQESTEQLLYSLDDMILDQSAYQIMDSARASKDDLGYLTQLLDQLRQLNTVAEIEPHWRTIDAKFGQLQAQLQQLQERIDADDFEEISDSWQQFSAQLTRPELLFQSYMHSISAKQQALQQLADLSQLIDQSESQLQAFTDNAQLKAEQAETNTEQTIQQASTLIAIASAAALLVATALSLIITRRIRHSLKHVMDGLNRVTEGDLHSVLDADGNDEFSHLARCVNHLTANLRELVLQIRTAVDDLQHNASTSNQVSQQTLDGVANQSLQSSRVAATMTELEASAAEVEQNAKQTLDDVLEAEASLNNGRNLMQDNSQTIGELSDQVGTSADQIQQLQQFCESIGDVVDVIRGIAEQTNLLALNAAIEAARAGEQGRGFAVVADEVRSLASRTQGSTVEIEQMVEKLQQGARHSVITMTECSTQASQSLVQMRSSTEQFDHVTNSVSRIRQMNAQVAQATGEQRSTTEEVSRSLAEINKITEETAEGARNTAQQSQALAALADQLDSVIGKFSTQTARTDGGIEHQPRR